MQDLAELSLRDRIRKVLIYLTPRQKGKEKENISNKFARRLGIAQITVANWLNKKSLPSSDGLHKLYMVYPNINYDWVITGRGNMIYRAEEGAYNPNMTAEEDSLLVELLRDELTIQNKNMLLVTEILDKNADTLAKNAASMERLTLKLEQLEKEKEQSDKEKELLKIKLARAAKALGDKISDMQG